MFQLLGYYYLIPIYRPSLPGRHQATYILDGDVAGAPNQLLSHSCFPFLGVWDLSFLKVLPLALMAWAPGTHISHLRFNA